MKVILHIAEENASKTLVVQAFFNAIRYDDAWDNLQVMCVWQYQYACYRI